MSRLDVVRSSLDATAQIPPLIEGCPVFAGELVLHCRNAEQKHVHAAVPPLRYDVGREAAVRAIPHGRRHGGMEPLVRASTMLLVID